MIGQTLIIMAGGLLLMLSTVALVRRQLLSIRYGIGWLMVGILGVLGTPVLTWVSNSLNMFGFTPTGFSLGVFILFLGLVCLQLSISLSALHRAIQDITEHAAHVDARVRRLEGDAAPLGALGARPQPAAIRGRATDSPFAPSDQELALPAGVRVSVAQTAPTSARPADAAPGARPADAAPGARPDAAPADARPDNAASRVAAPTDPGPEPRP